MFSVTEQRNGTAVIHPGITIEREHLRQLRLTLDTCLDHGLRQVVVDLSETEHLHYRAADLFTQTEHRLHGSQGHLVLAGANRYVRDILAFMCGDPRFGLSESLSEAIDTVSC